MAISAKDVMELRKQTDCGMMECKKALTEADGNFEKAIEILRERGLATAAKKASRVAAEGMVYADYCPECKVGVVIEVNAETDFVAKTPKFVEFTEEVLGYAVDADANSADELLEAKAGDTTVKLAVEEAAALFGEHVKVGQFAKISGEHVEVYAHKKSAEMPPSIVAMIATDKAGAAVAHEAALQISAMGAK